MTAKRLPPIGHLWLGDDNPVVAIEPAMPQVVPGLDVDALRCVGCGVEPVQRRDTTGRLMYLLTFRDRACERLAALYANPATRLFDLAAGRDITDTTT